MAKTLYSYISDIIHSGENVAPELEQVMKSVMEGKNKEERHSVIEGMMRDGFVRDIANNNILILINLIACGVVPMDNKEGVDMFDLVNYASSVGYFMGATLLSECYDEEFSFSPEKAQSDIDILYENLEKIFPGLCYLEEQLQQGIRAIIFFAAKLAVEHFSKGTVLDLLLLEHFPNWKEMGKFAEEELDDLYTPKPIDMGPYNEIVKTRFDLYETKKKFREEEKRREDQYLELFKPKDEKVIADSELILKEWNNIVSLDELDMTSEGILCLTHAEQLSLFLVFTRTCSYLTKSEAYKLVRIGFMLYDKLQDKIKKQSETEEYFDECMLKYHYTCVSFYVASHIYKEKIPFLKILEMSQYMLLVLEKQSMIETSDKNRIRRAKYISTLYFKLKEKDEDNKKAMQ